MTQTTRSSPISTIETWVIPRALIGPRNQFFFLPLDSDRTDFRLPSSPPSPKSRCLRQVLQPSRTNSSPLKNILDVSSSQNHRRPLHFRVAVKTHLSLPTSIPPEESFLLHHHLGMQSTSTPLPSALAPIRPRPPLRCTGTVPYLTATSGSG